MTSESGKLPHLARRVGVPVAILLAVAGLVAALAALGVDTTDALRHINYGAVALGLAVAFVVTRLLDIAVFDVGSRLRGRTPPPALLRQIVSIVVFGIALGIVFKRTMAADLGALLTTSAIITAVIGLALQDTLGNLFAGLALAIEETVRVGDMVRSGETIGIVEQLSWRAIKLRTLDGNLLLIPNSVAGRERLEIYRRPGPAVARSARIGIDYETPPAAVRERGIVGVRAARDTHRRSGEAPPDDRGHVRADGRRGKRLACNVRPTAVGADDCGHVRVSGDPRQTSPVPARQRHHRQGLSIA